MLTDIFEVLIMRIGVTEQGDAGLNYSWIDCIQSGLVSGAILITKNISDNFISALNEVREQFPNIIVHCTCTGWGDSYMEPNVPKYSEQLDNLLKLINSGFPLSNVVLRVDPIFPDKSGLLRAKQVLDFTLYEIPDVRVRISVFDQYKHVKERFSSAGIPILYNGSMFAGYDLLDRVSYFLSKYPFTFETCGEPYLRGQNIIQRGCVSNKDLEIFGITLPDTYKENPQGRKGCKCLNIKYEMLNNKHRCAHQCLYCYWHD